MSVIIRELLNAYHHYFVEISNPVVKDWFLMSSPVAGLALIAAYVYFANTLGPALMEGRKPFVLKRVLQIFNIIQVFLSAYMFYKFMKHGWIGKYNWRCDPILTEDLDPDSMEMASTVYMYFLVKLTDLLDTVFFVLRKKFNQITFLHVYHHAGMVAVAWGVVKWFTTGSATMLATINSLVHTVMYMYYFLTSLSDEYKKSIWWKKYITLMQIIQFMFMIVFYSQLIFYNPCNFPKFGLAVVIPQNFFMLTLFIDFYIKAYVRKSNQKKST